MVLIRLSFNVRGFFFFGGGGGGGGLGGMGQNISFTKAYLGIK